MRVMYGSSRSKNSKFPLIACSEISEDDIIFGGINKLKKIIIKVMELYKPKLLAIVSTCVPELIGEEISDVIFPLKKNKIIILRCSGFSSRTHVDGILEAYKKLIDLIPEQDTSESPYVNIIGEKSTEPGGEADFKEISTLLNQLGIKILVRFVRSLTLDSLLELPKARLNIPRCLEVAYEPCVLMEKRFKIPFIDQSFPLGIDETSRWLHLVAEYFGKENKALKAIRENERKYRAKCRSLEKYLRGKSIAISAGGGKALTLVKFAHNIGMNVVYVGIYTSLRGRVLQEFISISRKINPEIIIEPSFYEEEEVLQELKPDIFISNPSHAFIALRSGIAYDAVHQAPQVGYAGTLNLLKRWVSAIKHPVYDLLGLKRMNRNVH